MIQELAKQFVILISYKMLQIAWGVARTKNDNQKGPMNPVWFDYVDVNIGNAWQALNNYVVIPPSGDGMYYLHLMAYACWDTGIEMTLTRNGEPLFTACHNLSNIGRGSIREKSIITKLVAGDTLAVTTSSTVCTVAI